MNRLPVALRLQRAANALFWHRGYLRASSSSATARSSPRHVDHAKRDDVLTDIVKKISDAVSKIPDHHDDAVDIEHVMDEIYGDHVLRTSLSSRVMTSIVELYAMSKRPSDIYRAISLLNRMHRDGPPPNLRIYGKILLGISKVLPMETAIEAAAKVHAILKKDPHVKPNTFLYTCMLANFVHGHPVPYDEPMALYREMCAGGPATQPNEVTFVILITILSLHTFNHKEATGVGITLFRDLVHRRRHKCIRPRSLCQYVLLLRGLPSLAEAEEHLHEIEANADFAHILRTPACARAKQRVYDHFERPLRWRVRQKCEKIGWLLRNRPDAESCAQAEAMFGELMADEASARHITRAAANYILELYAGAEYGREGAQRAMALLEDIEFSNVRPDRFSYLLALRAVYRHASTPENEMFGELIIEWFEQNDTAAPNTFCYNILMLIFLRNGSHDKVLQTFRKMREMGHFDSQPDRYTLAIVFRVLATQAGENAEMSELAVTVMRRAVERGIAEQLTGKALGQYVYSLRGIGSLEKAEALVDELEQTASLRDIVRESSYLQGKMRLYLAMGAKDKAMAVLSECDEPDHFMQFIGRQEEEDQLYALKHDKAAGHATATAMAAAAARL